jgi:hypothetical protein
MIAAAQFSVTFAQTEPVIPSDLFAALQKDPGRELLECMREPDAPPLKDLVDARRFDLHRRQEAWLVEAISPCASAVGNGPKLLYIRVDKRWRKIFEGFGQGVSVCAEADPPCLGSNGSERGSAPMHGWPDLAIWYHGSAGSGSQTVHRFDGRAYKAVLCTDVESGVHRSPCISDWSLPKGTAADVPPDLLPTLQNDLQDHVKSPTDCWQDLKENVHASWFGGDGPEHALLVELAPPPPQPEDIACRATLAGIRNGELLVYIRAAQGWRKLLQTSGQSPAVCAAAHPPCPVPRRSKHGSTNTRGLSDLSLWRHAFTKRIVYRFDENVYKAVGCYDVTYANPGLGESSEPRYTPCHSNWTASER